MEFNGHTYHAITTRSDGGMINHLCGNFRMFLDQASELSENGGTFHVTSWDENNVPTVTEYTIRLDQPPFRRTLYRRQDTGTLDQHGRITFPDDTPPPTGTCYHVPLFHAYM